MAAKKEGNDIPKELNSKMPLSRKLSFFNAETMPKKMPRTVAMKIDKVARIKVLNRVSPIIAETFRLFWYERRS